MKGVRREISGGTWFDVCAERTGKNRECMMEEAECPEMQLFL